MRGINAIYASMKDKKARLHAIRNVVAAGGVQSQEQLVEMLARQDIYCTQTMLSRDLRQLRISKVRTKDGRQFYVLPREGQFITPPTKEEIYASKWDVQFSGNIAVVHTPPGHASLAAFDIDEQRSRHILGTVAGDDTVLVVLAAGVAEDKVFAVLKEAVPALKKNI